MAYETSPGGSKLLTELFSRMTLPVPDPDLERIALSDRVTARALCRAERLSDQAWDALWRMFSRDTKARAELVMRRLSPAQIETVCVSRPNARVVAPMLEANRSLSDEHLVALAGSAGTASAKKLADLVLDGSTPLSRSNCRVVLDLARMAGPARHLLVLIRGEDLFSDEDRWQALEPLRGSELRSRTAFRAAQLLMWRHPELRDRAVAGPRDAWLDVRLAGLPSLVDADQQVALADLGPSDQAPPQFSKDRMESLLSRRFVLMALVNLPACSIDLVEHVGRVCTSWSSTKDLTLEESRCLEELKVACARRLAAVPVRQQVVCLRSVSEPRTLDWLVNRAAPLFEESSFRPLEALELSYNPHLSPEQVSRLVPVFGDVQTVEVMGEQICLERHVALAGPDRQWWGALTPPPQPQPLPLSDPSVLPSDMVDELRATSLGRFRSSLLYYGMRPLSAPEGFVSPLDWFLRELSSRSKGDPTTFSAGVSLLEHLPDDETLSGLLDLVGVV